MSRLANWMRVAIVDLRGDLRRFGILLAALALGVGTIAGVSSVGAALQDTILRNANTLMGGDLQVVRADRRADAAEFAYIASLGEVSETISSNSRADAVDDSGNTVFLDIYASTATTRSTAMSRVRSSAGESRHRCWPRDGVYGAIVDPVILDRLGIDWAATSG